MKAFYKDFKLGIIGGGQLGRMLLQACPNFNLHTCVLDPSKEGPCSGLASEYTQGSLLDYETVYAFGKHVDLILLRLKTLILTRSTNWSVKASLFIHNRV